MTVIAIGAAGIAAVLMAVQLKGMKGEYATYLIIAAGFFIFFYGISKLESIMDTVERIQGYRDALEQYRLPFEERLIKYGDYTFESGYRAIMELEREGTRFTGVLAANDTMALGAHKAPKELTYAIPEDVEIIGFDNIGFSQLCDPPLATIQQPTIEMGRRAADTLIRAIVGKPIETKNIHLQPKLVVRGSVKTIYGERILYV